MSHQGEAGRNLVETNTMVIIEGHTCGSRAAITDCASIVSVWLSRWEKMLCAVFGARGCETSGVMSCDTLIIPAPPRSKKIENHCP